MSNNYVLTYKFVTGEITIIGLCELVARGKLTSDEAVKIESTMAELDDTDKKVECRETRRHSSPLVA